MVAAVLSPLASERSCRARFAFDILQFATGKARDFANARAGQEGEPKPERGLPGGLGANDAVPERAGIATRVRESTLMS